MHSNETLCVGIPFREITQFECSISRGFGTIILSLSFLSTIFSVRFLYWSSINRKYRSSHHSLIVSMIFSSMSVSFMITPSIIIQCLFCNRLCSKFYCWLEGFVSYSNGCFNMFLFMMISLIRYTMVKQTQVRKRYLKRYSTVGVAFCWLLSLGLALPPLFNWNSYIPEGIGFHCGLDWFDRSTSSRIYFALAICFVYCMPFLVLVVVNVYVYCLIRSALNQTAKATEFVVVLHKFDSKRRPPSFIRLSGSDSIESDKIGFSSTIHSTHSYVRSTPRHTNQSFQAIQTMHMNRLQADHKFASATLFLMSEYILGWTPYAAVVLSELFDLKLVEHHSLVVTVCAFIAKISIILNPCIYIATIKTNQLKSILFGHKM